MTDNRQKLSARLAEGLRAAFRVYCDEHAKYTDITVEHYSSIVAASELGVRKLEIKEGA